MLPVKCLENEQLDWTLQVLTSEKPGGLKPDFAGLCMVV